MTIFKLLFYFLILSFTHCKSKEHLTNEQILLSNIPVPTSTVTATVISTSSSATAATATVAPTNTPTHIKLETASTNSLTHLPTPTPKLKIAPLIRDADGNEQLTYQGNNRSPQFSSNDKLLIYTSSRRTSHRDIQIYKYTLTTNKESRVTFNDGTNENPQWGSQDHIVLYSSTTDEQKEFPEKIYGQEFHFLNQKFWDFEDPNIYFNSEIYSLSLDTKDKSPQRYTNHLGFDGFPLFAEDTSIYMVQKNKAQFGIVKLELKHKKQVRLWEQKNPIWKPAWNEKEHKWAWISWNLSSDKDILSNEIDIYEPMHSKNPEPLQIPKGIYHDINWVKGQNLLLISALLNGEKHYNIYQYDFNEKCLKLLLQNKGDNIDIAINHQHTEIVYSHKTENGTAGSFQIYKKPYQAPSSSCITDKTSL